MVTIVSTSLLFAIKNPIGWDARAQHILPEKLANIVGIAKTTYRGKDFMTMFRLLEITEQGIHQAAKTSVCIWAFQ